MPKHRTKTTNKKTPDDFDVRMMKRAIALARRGEGRVEPNPMVGCVVAKKDRIIGEGYHRRFGGPHAEIEALRCCVQTPRGATVYVSLEPCCHQNKTPPCTKALTEAGVARVVIALRDPNPAVHGGGIRRLRAAGIAVQVGLLADESAEILAPFLTRIRLGRPYIIAKWAQSLDGKLATHTGHSQWISCEASRRGVHRLRARVDAILVGSQTVVVDNPMLTARNVPIRRRALRAVLDGRLRTPQRCHLVDTAREFPTLVITSPKSAQTAKAKRLMRKGIDIVTCRTRASSCENPLSHLLLRECLAELAKRDVTNLLVEGGPTLLTAFFTAGLVDEALVFTAPTLIGGAEAPTAVAGRGVKTVDDAATPRSVQITRSGVDTLHRLRFSDPLTLV
ncbi:MAG: bifunctional diaminohydroxyphosphoribosylaminopyrimidine deaminase/5-amino-6-(5-phosphoribosylamino)uracil reductase RibD [Planctomycetota bacterium]